MAMIIATNNEGKLREIKEILKEYDLYSLKEKNIETEVEEDGETFLENAAKKAKTIYSIAKEATIADDSGLCIKALNGFPGVMTHRFLGEEKTDHERNLYLIEKLKDCSNRTAQVVCVLVYYDGEEQIVGEGILEGVIATECRGVNGFGFDEIFELPNKKTLGELTKEEKNEVSARKMAINDLKKKLIKKRIL